MQLGLKIVQDVSTQRSLSTAGTRQSPCMGLWTKTFRLKHAKLLCKQLLSIVSDSRGEGNPVPKPLSVVAACH